MSRLSDNLTTRRESLGLTVTGVHQELNRRGVPVAFSTVAGWFNGSRGVRNMENLRKLCDVLQTTIGSVMGDDIELVEGAVPVSIAREISSLTPLQMEAVLATIRAMKSPE